MYNSELKNSNLLQSLFKESPFVSFSPPGEIRAEGHGQRLMNANPKDITDRKLGSAERDLEIEPLEK